MLWLLPRALFLPHHLDGRKKQGKTNTFIHTLFDAKSKLLLDRFICIPYVRAKKKIFFFGEMNVWSTINTNRKSSICFTEFKAASILSLITKSLQSCPTLCDPIDGSPPGSPVPGILQARTLEWVAISFSNAWKVKMKSLSHVRLLATPWTVATRLLHPWDFPGKSTGVGCHCLLRSIL